MALRRVLHVVLGIAAMVCRPLEAGTGSWTTQEATVPTTMGPPLKPICDEWVTPRHTCAYGCDKLTWQKTQYCQCDPLCTAYGDCCNDYEQYCGAVADPSADEFSPSEFLRCVGTIDLDPETYKPRRGHHLVAVCPPPPGWSGDGAIRELCQGPAGSDGLAAIPVEGPGGRHYKNVYCALCHGVSFGDVLFWPLTFVEREEGELAGLEVGQFIQNAREGIPYLKEVNPPGFIAHNNYSEHLANSSLRACVLVDPVTCPLSSPVDQSNCEHYFAPMSAGGVTYRNPACYQCNNSIRVSPFNFENYVCSSLNEIWEFLLMGDPPSLATLLIFSDHTDVNGVGHSSGSVDYACASNQIYDPFLNLCRDLSCPDGFALEDGVSCARLPSTGASNQSAVRVTIGLTVAGVWHEGFGNEQGAGVMWGTVASQAVEDFVASASLCISEGGEEADNGGQSDEGMKNCEDANLTWACQMGGADWNPDGDDCGTGAVFTCSVNASFDGGVLPSVDAVLEESRQLVGKCFRGTGWSHTIRPERLSIVASCDGDDARSNRSADGGRLTAASTSRVDYTYDEGAGDFRISQNGSCMTLDCPVFTLTKDQYVITGARNDSIRLTQYDRVLQLGEYLSAENGDVRVCSFFDDVTSVAGDLWDGAHFILTVSGSSLSLLGVVVTIATYVAFPSLRRNAAGKSLVCLVGTLFFAQMTMLIGLERTEIFALCVTFATSSHYFWLSAFFWMNTLAIDIYRTFGIGTKINDPNTRSVRYYALYGLGAPALIVGTCLFLSLCDCVDFDVHYASDRACWIGGGMTNLVTFGVPVIAVLCCNAVLFSLTVAGVMKTRRASEKMNVTQGQGDAAAKSRRDLILYLKLTAIMGFTWIFGFVASFSGIQFFWYPFIVLNSLQGALVCLAFVCNDRVMTMWKKKLMGGDQSTSSTFSSTQRTNVPESTNG